MWITPTVPLGNFFLREREEKKFLRFIYINFIRLWYLSFDSAYNRWFVFVDLGVYSDTPITNVWNNVVLFSTHSWHNLWLQINYLLSLYMRGCCNPLILLKIFIHPIYYTLWTNHFQAWDFFLWNWTIKSLKSINSVPFLRSFISAEVHYFYWIFTFKNYGEVSYL